MAAPVIGSGQAERDLGLTREERSAIQRGLNALALEAGAADGLFGEMTREAIRRYQRDAGAPETGFLTADDAKALLARGAEEQVAAATPASPARGRGAPKSEAQVAVGRFLTVPRADGLNPGDVFRDKRKDGSDCPECPEMAVIPAGSFRMGSPDDDRDAFKDERPEHLVTIGRPFAVAQFPVTAFEYTTFFAEYVRERVGGEVPVAWEEIARNPQTNIDWGEFPYLRRMVA